jgi:hypothetical protein
MQPTRKNAMSSGKSTGFDSSDLVPPNQALQQTAAAMLVSRDSLPHSAAAAAALQR